MKKYAFYVNLFFTCVNIPFALHGLVLNIMATIVCGVATVIAYKAFDPFKMLKKSIQKNEHIGQINIEYNSFYSDDVVSISAEQLQSNGVAYQFEFEICSRVTLKNGQSFLVHMLPAEVAKVIRDAVEQGVNYAYQTRR